MKRALAAGGLAALLACAPEERRPPPAPAKPVAATPAPKILHFYAHPGLSAPGEPVLLCYGVEDATEVSIEPRVRELRPSYNRCFSITAQKSTTYRLTATGPGGTAAAEVSIVVQRAAAPRAAPGEGRLLEQLLASHQEVQPGQPVTLCYIVTDAVAVELDPPVARLRPVSSCFSVTLSETTTFTVTATDAARRTQSRQVTVRVR
jgi:hypothetical protein